MLSAAVYAVRIFPASNSKNNWSLVDEKVDLISYGINQVDDFLVYLTSDSVTYKLY